MDAIYKKIKFKARRGMLELDLLFKNYLNNNYSKIDNHLKQQFILLLDLSDPELYSLLILKKQPTDKIKQQYADIINSILQFQNMH